MTVRKYLGATLTVVMGMFAINAHARSWDLAVVAGRKVEFFAVNGSLNGQAMLEEAGSLSGVAYDDIARTIYFSDLNHENISIYSSDLTDKNFTLTPLLKRQEESNILGLAFDTRTRTLFWSDTKQGSIMRMQVPLDGPPEQPTLLHDLKTRIPRGIALDVCNRHIYWVDSNTSSPRIERSNLDGSNRTTVIGDRLHEPIAVAVDHIEEKLYWIDDVEGIRIKIERSNLDGSQRELLAYPKRQRPSYMAVDRDSIYWSDTVHKVVWTLPKTARADDATAEPSTFGSHDKYLDAIPAGIVARDNVGKLDCAAIAKTRHKTSLADLTYEQRAGSYINLTTSTEESELTTESSKYCLNDGRLDRENASCRCKHGYTGDYCETDLCHNYCFRGSCGINDDGLPTCKCNDTFVGPRCETDLCKDYCLHDGQCSVRNEKPVCKCKYFEGSRCEILNDTTEICKNYCENDETVPTSIAAICRCFEESESAQIVTFPEDEYGTSTLLPIFGVFVILLVLVIIVLSYYVNKLRRRPRIKKRFVVSKGGVTALTSRPQNPDSQCEITIENCCNMNICETPCFEPKLRAAAPDANGTKQKKEEKNSLLDNMEEITW